MSNAVVINLREVREIDAGDFLSGPLGRIRLPQLQPGQQETLVAEDQEHTLFTVRGNGKAVSGSATVPLRPGVALTLPLGSKVTVEAGSEGLELFIASLVTPQGAGAVL
jgi:mannose-6-phosphate isomerase-like protein (cupin superfamily)